MKTEAAGTAELLRYDWLAPDYPRRSAAKA